MKVLPPLYAVPAAIFSSVEQEGVCLSTVLKVSPFFVVLFRCTLSSLLPSGLLLLASPLPSVEDSQSSIATTTPNEPLKKPLLLSYIYSTSFHTCAQSVETFEKQILSVCSSSCSVQDNQHLTLW